MTVLLEGGSKGSQGNLEEVINAAEARHLVGYERLRRVGGGQ
jgi:hypothetical protein